MVLIKEYALFVNNTFGINYQPVSIVFSRFNPRSSAHFAQVETVGTAKTCSRSVVIFSVFGRN